MKRTTTRICTCLIATCAVWFAVTPAIAQTILNPNNPAHLLQFAQDKADALSKKANTSGKKKHGWQFNDFNKKVKRYKYWYDCVQTADDNRAWSPGDPVCRKLEKGDFVGKKQFYGPDFGLPDYYSGRPVTLRTHNTQVWICWDSTKMDPMIGDVNYILGTYTNGVILVSPGFGYWNSLTEGKFQALIDAASPTREGESGVDQGQFNLMLVAIYKELGLPIPGGGDDTDDWWEKNLPYVVAAAIALLVIVLALLLLRKRPAVKTCPKCGSALLPNGSCPICDTPPPPPPPPPVCSKCGSPLLPNGHCPVCPSDSVCLKCGTTLLPDGRCPKCDEIELCPTHNIPLLDGACPHGCTIPRCPRCGSILKNGKCQKCGGDDIEYCPTCGSEIVDDACPNGCTIVRCPDCGKIMVKGICPKGCTTPLSLGWSGSAKPTMSPWKLEIVAPARFVSKTCELPYEVVVGRSASERKTTDTYLQLQLAHLDKKNASGVSRRYVKLVCDPDTKEVQVELLSSSGNRAVVDGKPLSSAGDKAPLSEGGTLELTNAGYKLRLVRA